jgi:hypothetical protein
LFFAVINCGLLAIARLLGVAITGVLIVWF